MNILQPEEAIQPMTYTQKDKETDITECHIGPEGQHTLSIQA